LHTLKLGIPGSHQTSNAQLAVSLYRSFMRSRAGQEHFISLTSSGEDVEDLTAAEKKGLTEARWPGRCQTVRSKDSEASPVWFLDGAHTTESLESCAAWYVRASMEEKHSKPTRRTLIFNTTHDRKSEELLSGMMKAVGKELSQLEGSEGVKTFFDSAIFCTNATYKDGVSAGGESNAS
jgi:folylpolyglutamate synthase